MSYIKLQCTFQLQLRFSSVEGFVFLFGILFGPKISAFLKVKLLVKFIFCMFQLRFSWQKQGAHPLKENTCKTSVIWDSRMFSKGQQNFKLVRQEDKPCHRKTVVENPWSRTGRIFDHGFSYAWM